MDKALFADEFLSLHNRAHLQEILASIRKDTQHELKMGGLHYYCCMCHSFFFLENGLKSGLYIHSGCTQSNMCHSKGCS
jgi:hypothetical protein